MSSESFEQFRETVLRDRELQEALRATPDREAFISLVVGLGEERGYSFTAADVKDALQAGRRSWLERWV